jgi:hypothetical protein
MTSETAMNLLSFSLRLPAFARHIGFHACADAYMMKRSPDSPEWGRIEMDNTVTVALIGSSGSVLIGITALLLNYRGFVSLDHRLDLMQADMKGLNRTMTALEIDVARPKDQVGM